MRKWIAAAVGIIIIGLLAVSYYVAGLRAEKSFESFVTLLHNTPNLTVSAEKYHRGFLKSDVDMRIGIANSPVVFPLHVKIYHGPIILSRHKVAFGLGYARLQIPLPEPLSQQFFQLFTKDSTKPHADLEFILKYPGRLNMSFDVPSFHVNAQDNSTNVAWSGLNWEWKLSDDFSHVRGEVNFDGMNYTTPIGEGSIKAVKTAYDLKNASNNLVTGVVSLMLKNIAIQSPTMPMLSINDLSARLSSHVKKERVNTRLKVKVAKVKCSRGIYGPGVFDLDLLNLDAKAVNQIQQQIQAVGQTPLTESQQQVFIIGILPQLCALVQHGSLLEVKQFKLTMPDGDLEASLKVVIPPNAHINTWELIQKTTANLNAKLPSLWVRNQIVLFSQDRIIERQAMLSQLPVAAQHKNNYKVLSNEDIQKEAQKDATTLLDSLVQQHVLVVENNRYIANVSFQNGTLFVNGLPFSGSALQGVPL